MESDDPVDRLVEQWSRERPDSDFEPMALVSRLLRVAGRINRAVGAGLEGRGLPLGWFDVLSALRRSGEPFRLSPGRLSDTVMLSTGGMTKRLDGLEAAGHVRRLPDPGDRRGALIELTARGRRLIDSTIDAHVENERRLLNALSAAERAQLEELLRKLDRGI